MGEPALHSQVRGRRVRYVRSGWFRRTNNRLANSSVRGVAFFTVVSVVILADSNLAVSNLAVLNPVDGGDCFLPRHTLRPEFSRPGLALRFHRRGNSIRSGPDGETPSRRGSRPARSPPLPTTVPELSPRALARAASDLLEPPRPSPILLARLEACFMETHPVFEREGLACSAAV